jgi:dihydroorotate dehydrogenase
MTILYTPTAWVYQRLIKPVLFRFDPEDVHDATVRLSKFAASIPPIRWVISHLWVYRNPLLEQKVCGISFCNPIGLAGGFDKNAELTQFIPLLGFGFTEVGSITQYPCDGNPRPRLWRMPESKSILVYYGLKNNGVDEISSRLQKNGSSIPIGTNIAKTNSKEACDDDVAIEDYAYSFQKLANIGDYFTVNISCPNTYGGQPFTDKTRLDALLSRLDTIKTNKPVFIKLSPDITDEQRKDIAALSFKHRVDGFICTNLVKSRKAKGMPKDFPSENGGMSGGLVRELSDELISDMYKYTKGKKIIIGCGGVFTAKHAYEKIKRGATLIQMITGMIYQGPQVVANINKDLAVLLRNDGYLSISEAVGSSHPIDKI